MKCFRRFIHVMTTQYCIMLHVLCVCWGCCCCCCWKSHSELWNWSSKKDLINWSSQSRSICSSKRFKLSIRPINFEWHYSKTKLIQRPDWIQNECEAEIEYFYLWITLIESSHLYSICESSINPWMLGIGKMYINIWLTLFSSIVGWQVLLVRDEICNVFNWSYFIRIRGMILTCEAHNHI